MGPLLYYTSRNKFCISPSGPLTVLHTKKQVLHIPKGAPHCTTHQETSSLHPQVGPTLYYTSRNKFSTSPSGPHTVLHIKKQVLYIPKRAPYCTTHQETSSLHPQVTPSLYYTPRNKFSTSPSGPLTPLLRDLDLHLLQIVQCTVCQHRLVSVVLCCVVLCCVVLWCGVV